MKKFLYVLSASVLLVGCGSNQSTGDENVIKDTVVVENTTQEENTKQEVEQEKEYIVKEGESIEVEYTNLFDEKNVIKFALDKVNTTDGHTTATISAEIVDAQSEEVFISYMDFQHVVDGVEVSSCDWCNGSNDNTNFELKGAKGTTSTGNICVESESDNIQANVTLPMVTKEVSFIIRAEE